MNVVIDGVEYRPIAPTLPKELPLGDFLKATRKALGVTLDHGSEAIGCAKSYLWELEKGKSEPSLRMATRIAEVYGIRIEEMALHLTPNAKVEADGAPLHGAASLSMTG